MNSDIDYVCPPYKVSYASDATTDECGDAATSYYKEFMYNGKRVIVSNNVKLIVILIDSNLCNNSSDPRSPRGTRCSCSKSKHPMRRLAVCSVGGRSFFFGSLIFHSHQIFSVAI